MRIDNFVGLSIGSPNDVSVGFLVGDSVGLSFEKYVGSGENEGLCVDLSVIPVGGRFQGDVVGLKIGSKVSKFLQLC